MTIQEYQALCVNSEPPYLTRGDEALLGLMDLNSASGQLFEQYKKSLFEGAELAPERFLEALGEVVKNVSILAHVVDKSLGDVLRASASRMTDAGDRKEL